MIVKRRFSPARVVPYARREAMLGLLAGVAAFGLVAVAGLSWLQVPGTVAVVLGTALAILLGFRANAAYQRWWDAAGAWMQIVAASRSFARTVVALGNARQASRQDDAEAIGAWQRRMVRRQIGWTHALRLQLRGQDDPDLLAGYLGPEEAALIRTADGRAGMLLQLHSQDIFAGYAAGFLAGFDNFQLEQLILTLGQQQALVERIKHLPIPRPYAVFASAFVQLYVLVFPFTLMSALQPAQAWMAIPIGLVVGAVFGLVEKTATVSEDPFENRIQDVPLTAICTTIERDLLEQIGDADRPPRPAPVDGYLW